MSHTCVFAKHHPCLRTSSCRTLVFSPDNRFMTSSTPSKAHYTRARPRVWLLKRLHMVKDVQHQETLLRLEVVDRLQRVTPTFLVGLPLACPTTLAFCRVLASQSDDPEGAAWRAGVNAALLVIDGPIANFRALRCRPRFIARNSLCSRGRYFGRLGCLCRGRFLCFWSRSVILCLTCVLRPARHFICLHRFHC